MAVADGGCKRLATSTHPREGPTPQRGVALCTGGQIPTSHISNTTSCHPFDTLVTGMGRARVRISDAYRLFFSTRVLAYTKRHNTCGIRFVPLPMWVLSLHLYSGSLLGLSYIVVTTDMFFSFNFETKSSDRKAI